MCLVLRKVNGGWMAKFYVWISVFIPLFVFWTVVDITWQTMNGISELRLCLYENEPLMPFGRLVRVSSFVLIIWRRQTFSISENLIWMLYRECRVRNEYTTKWIGYDQIAHIPKIHKPKQKENSQRWTKKKNRIQITISREMNRIKYERMRKSMEIK